MPVFAGGLDFSAPVKKFFYDPIYKSTNFVDCVISLTGYVPAALLHINQRAACNGLNVVKECLECL